MANARRAPSADALETLTAIPADADANARAQAMTLAGVQAQIAIAKALEALVEKVGR